VCERQCKLIHNELHKEDIGSLIFTVSRISDNIHQARSHILLKSLTSVYDIHEIVEILEIMTN
jgi:hypothetical protein